MDRQEQGRQHSAQEIRVQSVGATADSGYVDRSRDFLDRLKRVSWSSVFAGALVALMVQLSLSLLGMGIGLSTINPTSETDAAEGLGTGAAIWYAVSSLIALFIGGWVAGRLARSEKTFDGALHGILTWGVLTLFSFYLVTTALGNVIGGVGRLVGGTMRTAGNVTANSPEIQSQLKQAYQQGQDELQQAAQSVTQQAQSPQAQQRARQVAEQTADALSTASLIAFVGLILGAAAAGWGARQGTIAHENDHHWAGANQPALG